MLYSNPVLCERCEAPSPHPIEPGKVYYCAGCLYGILPFQMVPEEPKP